MNLDLGAFTYITGLVALLGFALQLTDVFPEHRETRKTIVLLVIGVFVGSLVSALRGVKVDIGAALSSTDVIKYALLFLIGVIAVVAVFAHDRERRMELFLFAGAGTGALLLILFVTGLGSIEESKAERERQQITLEELLSLATASISKENYDRALMFLHDAKTRISHDDERRKILEQREAEVRDMQLRSKR